MVPKVQLLVHAGAASSRKDDDRHRAQAEAYLRFTGKRITSHTTGETSSQLRPLNGHALNGDATRSLPEGALLDPSIYLDDTQSAFTALESQILTSSLSIHHKSRVQKRPAAVLLETTTLPPVRSESPRQHETSSDQTRSSYLRSPVLDRSNKRRRLEPFEDKSRAPLLPPFDPVPDPAEHKASAGSNDITSQLPSSYALSDVTSASSRKHLRPSQRSTSDPGPHVTSSPLDSYQKSSHDHASSQGARPLANTPVVKPRHKSDAADTNNEACQTASLAVQRPADNEFQSSSAMDHLPLIIRPRGPPARIDKFATHVTGRLRYLAEEANLSNHYKPVSVARDLRTSERGRWSIDPSRWDTKLQADFWTSLQRMIGDERVAGWGVWCSREPNTKSPLGTVNVFCWGEVVKHVYLLLYVASRSQVRKIGLQWIDGEEKVVIQMRRG